MGNGEKVRERRGRVSVCTKMMVKKEEGQV